MSHSYWQRGPVAAGLDETEVLSPLVTAYQQLYNKGEPRSPVLYAGNAVESFLTQLAAKHGVSLSGAPGINAKVEKIAQAGHLATKHKFILKYIGHVRNAADHGTDAEINSTWDIGADTAVEYVHVALSAVKSVVLAFGKQYVL